MDFIPIEYDDSGTETDNFKVPFGMLAELWKIDAEYIYPLPHFQPMRLQTINRFIEVFGTSNHSEPEITKFLAQKENQFILLTKFGATQLHAEVLCEWQDTERAAIKPDFFVVQPDGYADIVEFKLPNLKATALVGTENRERLSAELASYVAQTRVYVEYFESSANREWVKNKYGFSVRHPDRILVVGRRYDLESDSWRAVASDFPNLRVISYDDLVDGVVAQFYS